jgi:hypothetical protein
MLKALCIVGLCGVLALPIVSCQRSSVSDKDEASAEAQTITAPQGTVLTVSLQTPLSTESNTGGETFRTTLVEPVMAEGRTVLPGGSTVWGTLTTVQAPGEGEEMGRIVMTLTSAEPPSGESLQLGTNNLEVVANPSTGDDLEKVAAGGVAGGVIGGILGGGKGAVAGAVAGAGAGTVVAILTQDKHVHLEPGQKLQFALVQPAEFPLLASAASMGR